MTNNQDSELQGAEREREALAHIRKEQELRTGASFDHWLLKYLEEGDTPHFREQLRTVTKDYLFEVTRHPHIIKAAVPDWVTRLLVVPMPPKSNYDLRLFNPGLIADPTVPVYSQKLDELSKKVFDPMPKSKPEDAESADDNEINSEDEGIEVDEAGKFHYFKDGKWHDIVAEDPTDESEDAE